MSDKVVKKERNDFLKLVAIMAMLVDHVGAAFYPHLIELRIIGRLTLPIFALGIAEGYRYTSNLKKYITRVLIVGLIAQIPFSLLFETRLLNIVIQFAISLVLLELINNKKVQFRILYIISLLTLLLVTEYGLYGFVMIYFYYLWSNNNYKLFTAQGILIAFSTFLWESILRPFHFLGIILSRYFPNNLIRINLGRYFFYWFYPLHLFVLYLLKTFIYQ